MFKRKYAWSKFNKITVPKKPGVYAFINKSGKIIYIGKSVSIKDRLSSYRNTNLLNKTKAMVSEAIYFTFEILGSEYQALIGEAQLIKKYQPKYNIDLKDDKSPLYVVITGDIYPLVKFLRQNQLKYYAQADNIFGPFLDSRKLLKLMRYIRQIYPYATHKPTHRVCLQSQIGLCNPCPSKIENTSDSEIKTKLRKEYRKNINNIIKILSGKSNVLVKKLNKEIKTHSKILNFEKANEAYQKLKILNLLFEPKAFSGYLENPNFSSDIWSDNWNETYKLLNRLLNLKRLEAVECYDVSHNWGKYISASLISFLPNGINKEGYRHFKLNDSNGFSDTDSMYEIALRRSKHIKDWLKPDLIILDGGPGQISSFKRGLKINNVIVVGFEKETDSIVYQKQGNRGKYFKIVPPSKIKNLFVQIRDESHRFANRYRKIQLGKNTFINSNNQLK